MRALLCVALACAYVAVSVDADTPWHDSVTREFESRVNAQLAYVRRALAADRAPDLTAAVAADNAAAHSYADKYLLTEYAQNTAIAAVSQQLEALGLNTQTRNRLIAAVQGTDGGVKKTATLRFRSKETCDFVRTATREVQQPNRHVTTTSILGLQYKTEEKVITTVTEHFWRYELAYEFEVFTGTGDTADGDLKFTIRQRMPGGARELVTGGSTASPPRPEVYTGGPFEVDITWLLQQYKPRPVRTEASAATAADAGQELVPAFAIDRSDGDRCRTPRRNPQTEASLTFWALYKHWNERVRAYVDSAVSRDGSSAAIKAVAVQAAAVSSGTSSGVFIPVLPLFDSLKPDTNRAPDRTRTEPLTNAKTTASASASASTSGSGYSASNVSSTSPAQAAPVPVDIGSDDPRGTGAVPLGLVNEFLAFQKQTLHERMSELNAVFDDSSTSNTVITAAEARLALVTAHGVALCRAAADAVDSVEQMLYRQLQQALGRELTPADVDAYAAHHLRGLYRREYAPRPFSYAIRRPNAYPDGALAIEARPRAGSAAAAAAAEHTDRAAVLPVNTIVARSVVRPRTARTATGAVGTATATGSGSGSGSGGSGSGMSGVTGFESAASGGDGMDDSDDSDDSEADDGAVYIALDATTRVAMYGERYVHGLVSQSFGGEASPFDLHLVARAKEFSSFVVLCGRMVSRDAFDPQFGLIVQNREELQLPLWLESLPTAREFRDAIASMSPEQQRFAKGYRALQLQSTVFGVAVVQIKPALERVLNLPPHSLTKEIELTQHIMRLLIDFQIPSDQIAFTASTTATATTGTGAGAGTGRSTSTTALDTPQSRVEAVREQVKRLTALTERIVSAAAPPPPPEYGSVPYSKKGAKRSVAAAPRFEEVHGDAEMMPSMMEIVARFKHHAESYATAASASAASAQYGGVNHVLMDAAPQAAPQADADAGHADAPADTQNPKDTAAEATAAAAAADEEVTRGVDYTSLPAVLEAAYARYGLDAALRPTVIHTGSEWTRTRHSVIGLSAAEVAAARAVGSGASSAGVSVSAGAKGVEVLNRDAQRLERTRALDLLDALTRSGDRALPLVECALHVVVAATHAFARSVVDTVVRDSRNPIEALERSSLVVAATIFHAVNANGRTHTTAATATAAATAAGAGSGSGPSVVLPHQLVRSAQLPRLVQLHPLLAPPLPAPPVAATAATAATKST